MRLSQESPKAAALAACGVRATSTPGSMAPTSGQSAYIDFDGSVRYDVLRQTFGAPNENLVINPRATDVARTPSAGSCSPPPKLSATPSGDRP